MEVDNQATEIKLNLSIEENPSSSKLGLCEVCAYHDAKYTCPRCEVKTCSLRCNKIHKLEVECDGERNRAKFVPLKKFTNLDLSSDYRLLEEITRNVESSRKKYGKRVKYIPQFLFKLRNAAQARNTRLKYLPFQFARHKNNTTKFDAQNNKILWHIDWIFTNAENFKIPDTGVDENLKLGAILEKFLRKQEDPVLQEKLQFYQSANLPGINIYLKAEQKGTKKFYQLDCTRTLKESLQKKLIIEYPTIHLVLKGHESCYNVIDSDDEEEKMDTETNTKSGKQVIDKIISNAEDEDSLYYSLKNLLFISEYSDEELD